MVDWFTLTASMSGHRGMSAEKVARWLVQERHALVGYAL
jgi:hypothetical protein